MAEFKTCLEFRDWRNAQIIEAHRKGTPPKALAVDFKLTIARISQILRAAAKETSR
jgi:uncharacterized protein (DUF433 family)